MSKPFLSISLFLAIFLLSSTAYADAYKYRIAGNKIILFGKTVKVDIPLRKSRPKKESDTTVDFYPSPNYEHVVTVISTLDKNEFFIYSKKQDGIAPLQFEHGADSTVEWLNDRLIAVTWGGMEYSMTRIIDIANPGSSHVIDDVIQFVTKSNYYISSAEGGIKVGCIETCGHEPETFTIKKANGEPISSLIDIDSIHEREKSIVVEVHEREGKPTERIVYPKFLQQ